MNHRSKRSEEEKRRKDLEFLARLRTASMDELQKMLADHSHKNAPAWKAVAIQRAIRRCSV